MIGGGLAGLSSAVVLAESGFAVSLLEKRPHLGGRATSYVLPNGEHVDNCQHVTMGCCTNLANFYERVGAAHKIRFYDRLAFLDARGRHGVVARSRFAPPFHLAPSFLSFPALSWFDKATIASVMLQVAINRGRPPDANGTTMLDWLRRHRQTPGAIQRFWRVVLVSALNEELERAEARYGVDVFWKGFLANRGGFEVGVPVVPLGELYDGCRGAIERRGGEVRTRASVRKLRIAEGAVTGVGLEDETDLQADYYLVSVPHDGLLEILPERVRQSEPTFSNLANLRTSPITGVHLWFDRHVMTEPFLTLLDRTVQWVFNKSQLYGDHSEGQYIQAVISASYDLVPRARQEIIDLCSAELREALPAAREANLLKATVIKETAATFSPEPGCDRWRPGQRSPIKNLFLAGDWTQTGWPATMESAVRSGYLAAEAILADAGRPQRLVRPDLPAEGLAALRAQ